MTDPAGTPEGPPAPQRNFGWWILTLIILALIIWALIAAFQQT